MTDYVFRPTHKGLFLGIVPVLVDMHDPECPGVSGRWPGCELLLCTVEGLFGLFCVVATAINPDFEPAYRIRLTGEIDK